MRVRYCFKMHQGFCFYLCTVKPFDTSASLTTLTPLTVWITTNCGKFLKTWDTLTPSCENCMPVKKQQLEPVGEQWTGSKLRKEYIKAIYCHPVSLTSMQSKYIMQNAGLDEAHTGIKIAGRNINNLRYADDAILMAESREELKSLLMKVKEESEKAGLKLNIQKTGVWSHHLKENRWETVEKVTDFIFLGFKITADGDCNHEIKTPAPWKKSYDQSRQNIKKKAKVHRVKSMVLPLVMYGCESWTIKKAEGGRIDAF